MNAMAIFGLIEKGLTVLPILINAGSNVISLIDRMRNVATAAKEGKTVELSELEALEAELDAALAEFNSPLPNE